MFLKIIQSRKFWIRYIGTFVFLFVLVFLFHNFNILVSGLALGIDYRLILISFFDFDYTFDTFGIFIFMTSITLASYVFALTLATAQKKISRSGVAGSLLSIFGTFCFACGFALANIFALFGLYWANVDKYIGIGGILLLLLSSVLISRKIARGLC